MQETKTVLILNVSKKKKGDLMFHTGKYHPPKKKLTYKQELTNILVYSAKKKIAKLIAEYSTL